MAEGFDTQRRCVCVCVWDEAGGGEEGEEWLGRVCSQRAFLSGMMCVCVCGGGIFPATRK